MLHPLLLPRLQLLLPPLLLNLLLLPVGVLGAIFLFAVTTKLQVCWRELKVEEFGFVRRRVSGRGRFLGR